MRTAFTILILCSVAFGQSFGGGKSFSGGKGFKGGGPTPIVWTPSQVACSTTTGCPASSLLTTGTSATATFNSSLTVGDSGIIIVEAIASSGTSPLPSGVSCTGTCTIVGPDTSCRAFNATIGVNVNCYYFLSASGGQTDVTVTYGSSQSFGFVVAIYHKSGTASFDASNNTSSTCSSCSGSTLIITGTDVIVRAPSNDAGIATGVGSYTCLNPNTTDLPCMAYNVINSTVGSQTWTYGSSAAFMEAAIALK